MKVLTGLLVICAVAWNADALRCRRCIGATSIEDCTSTVQCGRDELCYMDQIVTDQLSVEYNGGCRPRDVCLKSPGQIGKRSGGLTMCSKCCSTDDCGASLCNIPSLTVNNNQCYKCSDVTDINQCTSLTLTTCQSDEMCMAETFLLSGRHSYRAGCINKRLCTLLTQEALKRRKECDNHPDPFVCGNVGKRMSGTKICTACCGDGGCNGDTCENVLDRLFKLWSAGVLDFNTLKAILPFTSTTYASVSST